MSIGSVTLPGLAAPLVAAVASFIVMLYVYEMDWWQRAVMAVGWYLFSLGSLLLAGMIFAGAMTTISLAGERAYAEAERGVSYTEARRIAMQAALIPMINSLFAVGLVSLPGMMTGQILSGVSPLVAAKYQIVVMSMLFGVTGISAAIFLHLERNELKHRASNT